VKKARTKKLLVTFTKGGEVKKDATKRLCAGSPDMRAGQASLKKKKGGGSGISTKICVPRADPAGEKNPVPNWEGEKEGGVPDPALKKE